MEHAARGLLDGELVALWIGLALVGLAVARAAVALPAADRRARRLLGATLLAAAAAAGALQLAAPRLSLVASRGGEAALAPSTEALLDRLGPAEALVVWPDPAGDELSRALAALLDRMRARDPRLAVRWSGAAGDVEAARALADRAGVAPELLAQGGVLLERAGRARFVPRGRLGRFALDEGGDPYLAALSAEGALAAALGDLSAERPPVACFVRGHGEADPESLAVDGASDLAALLRTRGVSARGFELVGGDGAACAALVVAGPVRPLAPEERQALAAWLWKKPVVVFAGPSAGADVAALLAGAGVTLGPPLDGTARVELGYGGHPAVDALFGRRTLWRSARSLGLLASGASPVPAGAGLAAAPPSCLPLVHGDDPPSPLLAVSCGLPRLTVLGADTLARNGDQAGWNLDLAAAAIEFAVRGVPPSPPATPIALTRLRSPTVSAPACSPPACCSCLRSRSRWRSPPGGAAAAADAHTVGARERAWRSSASWHSRQRAVHGIVRSRAASIGWSHSMHWPNSPRVMRPSACSICAARCASAAAREMRRSRCCTSCDSSTSSRASSRL
jgi:hypothetical protein